MFENLPGISPESGARGTFYHVSKEAIVNCQSGATQLPQGSRWMAIARFNVFWMEPHFGGAQDPIPAETQFLLLQSGEQFTLSLPLIHGDLRATLTGSESGVAIAVNGALPGQEPESARLLYVATGAEPYALITEAVAEVSSVLKSFRLRTEKPLPEFIEHFGWCTWDAFYGQVTHEKVVEGLASFKAGGVQPGFMIVDDGWLDNDGDYLNSFGTNAKFPHGLGALAKTAREEYQIKVFGVWHAFHGYWGGVNPGGELGKRYKLIPNRGKIRPWEGDADKDIDLSLVDPAEIRAFYEECYAKLREETVQMVKVDAQCSNEIFSHGKLGRVSTMQAYQRAFQEAGSKAFGANLLHCMSQGSDVPYLSQHSNAIRNSDDYIPKKPDDVQQRHIVMNAYNALWLGQVATPDWDMFQTNRHHSAFHAAARALSGGPIYVSDEPEGHDFALLEKLVYFAEGTARSLRCPHPAMATRDRLLVDCTREPRLLKIFNSVGETGLLGMFHVTKDAAEITDTFKAADVEGLKGERFAIWRHRAETLEVTARSAELSQTLSNMTWEIAVCAPIENGVAVIGLLDKFNSPAGVSRMERASGSLLLEVLDGGRVGVYSEQAPQSARVNGEPAEFTRDATTGLTILRAPKRQRSVIELRW